MSGTTTQKTDSQQQGSTNPWAPSMPMLQSIFSQLQGANYAPTTAQSTAASKISGEAGQVPSYLPQGEGAVGNLFNWNTTPQQTMSTDAFGKTLGALSPYLQPGFTNPFTNPATAPALSTMTNDITNAVAGQFAGAGRGGPSFYGGPSNAYEPEAISRGLAMGLAPTVLNESNTLSGEQQAAASELTGAANSTGGALTAEQQAALQAGNQGIALSSAIPGMAVMPGQAAWDAAGLNANLPISNLGGIEQLGVPLAGLGNTYSQTGSSTTSQSNPNFLPGLLMSGLGLLGSGGMSGIGGMLGGLGSGIGALGSSLGGLFSGAGGGILSMLPMLGGIFSDERVKDDIEKVGELYDETPVYSYKYKGDPTPRIGLIAQDVEKREPAAVHNFPGTNIKMVDYGKATERARRIGMLADLAMAA